MAKTEFEQFIQDEIEKQKGISVPVKAGFVERMATKKLDCDQLHPNPDDEFSFPDIGPNFEIISDYMKQIRERMGHGFPPFEDPVIVEKIRPEGYRLLNGHHRWAAAVRLGVQSIPVKIVNLPLESDITTILENSKHDKRVTMDLDEVIFRDVSDPYTEPLPKWLASTKHKERLRLGIPAIMHFFAKKGYDIWVYSSSYYSIDDIQELFLAYSVNVTGIITGTAKKNVRSTEAEKRMKELFANKYRKTVHIDNDMIVITNSADDDFTELSIEATDDKWSAAVIDLAGELGDDEKEE